MPEPTLQARRRRRKLAQIALACGLPLIFLIYYPRNYLENLAKEDSDAVNHHPWLAAYQNAELRLRDSLQLYGRSAALDPRIVFLAIDSKSTGLQEVLPEEIRDSPTLQLMAQGFPWNRQVYGYAVERLVKAGAKVVTFDIRFPSEKAEDGEVRPIFDRYRNSLVIGSNLEWAEGEEEGQGIHHLKRPNFEKPSPSLIANADGTEVEIDDDRTGFVTFQPDLDGKVRAATYRTNLQEYFGEPPDPDSTELLSLAARTAAKAGFAEAIPRTHGKTMIRFVENADLRKRSLVDIFVPTLWEKNFQSGGFFKDKIVFIGPFANWVKESNDVLPTPYGPTLGPQIHISALNALLTGQFLSEPPWWLDAVLVLGAGFLAWVAGILVAGPINRTLALVGIAAAYLLVAFLLYNTTGLCLSLMSPLVGLLSSGAVGLFWERVIEGQEKARVRKTLERYVSKDVVKEVLDNPQSYLHTAGGERRPLTILFSDVRGFTTITESADPAKLVEQLNEYFTEMVRIVFAHRGTLDKFIGDAVMAHWGGIMSRGKGPDACRAVAAALDMLKALDRLNADWKARGMIELRIGLGVNHGDAICANIGSEEKREFTAIGDSVNLASRLEGATKEFKQDLLIGEGVAPLVQGDYLLRSVDFLQVKGKTKPVEIFSVVAARNGEAPAWLSPYEEGIRLFRQRAFAEAAAKFAAAAELVPGDYLTQEYLRRSREYVETPPPADWNGVFVMTKK